MATKNDITGAALQSKASTDTYRENYDKIFVKDDKNPFTVNTAPIRIQSGEPSSYRLARKPNGELVLQGAYRWWEGTYSDIEWLDIPTVDIES